MDTLADDVATEWLNIMSPVSALDDSSKTTVTVSTVYVQVARPHSARCCQLVSQSNLLWQFHSWNLGHLTEIIIIIKLIILQFFVFV